MIEPEQVLANTRRGIKTQNIKLCQQWALSRDINWSVNQPAGGHHNTQISRYNIIRIALPHQAPQSQTTEGKGNRVEESHFLK